MLACLNVNKMIIFLASNKTETFSIFKRTYELHNQIFNLWKINLNCYLLSVLFFINQHEIFVFICKYDLFWIIRDAYHTMFFWFFRKVNNFHGLLLIIYVEKAQLLNGASHGSYCTSILFVTCWNES